MKVSASISAFSSLTLQETVAHLDALCVDSLHIDCTSPSIADTIEQIRTFSSTPIDLHIIAPHPEQFYPLIEKYAIESVQVQYEALHDAHFQFPNISNTRLGIGITSSTPLEVLDRFNSLDFVLFMCTTPGKSGGHFDANNFARIRAFRDAHQDKEIRVDGGVNGQVAFILRHLGVSSIVSGSFIAENASPVDALLDLRIRPVESEYKIGDFMIRHIPILPVDASLLDVMRHIDDYQLGFVIFTEPDGSFAGIASNADVRKALIRSELKYIPSGSDCINRSPFVLNEQYTITQMLDAIRRRNFVVNFVPIVNDENRPTGAITFFNLIRSEL